MSCLDQAKTAVEGDRKKDYGDVVESFGRIAGLWTAYLGIHVTPKDVGNLMILLKTSRAKTSNKLDNQVDTVGYSLCIEQLVLAGEDDI
jgi:hypothetical protein